MTPEQKESLIRLESWKNTYGQQKQPRFIDDLETVLEMARQGEKAWDRLQELQARIERQSERLLHQTKATKESADYWHERVLERIKEYLPTMVNHYGHPIDQLASMAISNLHFPKVEELQGKCEALESMVDELRGKLEQCRFLIESIEEVADLDYGASGIIESQEFKAAKEACE